MYRRPLLNLANVDGFLLAIDVKRKERIGKPTVECLLKLLLPCQRVGIGQVRAATSTSRRSQILGRDRMVQLGAFSQSLELSGALVERRIVNGSAAGAREGEVS